uniref:Ig-like domain-containing protein n=1 Tax=Lepisosteus oculatus TaxID=7918 RepID=W5N7A2_LEPOC
MLRVVIGVTVLLHWLTGPSDSTKVHQNPPVLLMHPDETAELNCSHSITGYYVTLWYQQTGGERSLKLIGYVSTTSPSLEDNADKRFSLSGDGSKNTTLKVSSLKVTDSAVYFCAASQHSDTDQLFPLQKPLRHNSHTVHH